jgi:hypothetical protein
MLNQSTDFGWQVATNDAAAAYLRSQGHLLTVEKPFSGRPCTDDRGPPGS